MTATTGFSAIKSALVTQLAARPGLAGVEVAYEMPERANNVAGQSGNYDAVWFEGAPEGSFDNTVFRAGGLLIDETYVQDMVIQVLRPLSDGTQQVADERAQQILGEVFAELSAQAGWDKAGLGLANLLRLVVTPASQEWVVGRIGGKPGHLSALVLGLEVEARWSPDGTT